MGRLMGRIGGAKRATPGARVDATLRLFTPDAKPSTTAPKRFVSTRSAHHAAGS